MTDLVYAAKIIAHIVIVSMLVHVVMEHEFAWVWHVPDDTVAGVAIGTLIYFVSTLMRKK